MCAIMLLNNMNPQLNLPFSNDGLGGFDISQSIKKCLASRLELLKGKRIIFNHEDKVLVPIDGWGIKASPYCATITTVQPREENALVASVDSSSVQLAETEDGVLYGAKGGIAISYSGRALMHFRIGPILFYLSEETIRDSELDHRLAKLVLLDSDFAKRLVRIRIERAVQIELSNHFTNSVLLVDGSLRASVFEDRRASLKRLVENCAIYKNTIVGISKGTRFKILKRISAPLTKVPGPAYIEVDAIVKSLVRNSIGNNIMIKFGKNSPVLRADIVGNIDESLGKILGNDSVAGGYPQTLSLAHHISTFSITEIMCLKSHVLNNYKVIELAAEDIRRTLLGSISM